MRIKLVGPTARALAHQLTLEGEEIVSSDEELLLTNVLAHDKSKPVIGGDYVFPKVVSDTMGFAIVEHACEAVVIKWFDHHWHDQTMLGFPLLNLMNSDLGAPAEVGIACRYIHSGPLVDLFNNDSLAETLRELHYIGLVSISIDLDGSPVCLRTGAPCWAMFNLLEGIRGRTVEFLTGEVPGLMESWTVGLLLSRFPWPHIAPITSAPIRGVTSGIEKHFWFLDVTSYKKSFISEGPLVGVATSWSQTLSEASRRTMRTLEAISVPGMQYRTDIVSSVGERMRVLADKGWVI